MTVLTLYVDADNITEEHLNFATGTPNGTRLTLQKTYRAIKTVQATVVGTTALTAIVADKQNVAGANNGPQIRTLNSAGTVVAGVVDVLVSGY